MMSHPTSGGGGVLKGLHPDHEEFEEYQYEDYGVENKTEDIESSSFYQLPLSPADQKMKEILNSLPMITTKAPKRSNNTKETEFPFQSLIYCIYFNLIDIFHICADISF